MVLLTLLAAVTIGVVRTRNLFGVIVLAGIYSFLMASVLIVLDAVDVAMTEAAVGAGVSTVLLLATLHLTKSMEYPRRARPICRCSSPSAPVLRLFGEPTACRPSERPTTSSTSTSCLATWLTPSRRRWFPTW